MWCVHRDNYVKGEYVFVNPPGVIPSSALIRIRVSMEIPTKIVGLVTMIVAPMEPVIVGHVIVLMTPVVVARVIPTLTMTPIIVVRVYFPVVAMPIDVSVEAVNAVGPMPHVIRVSRARWIPASIQKTVEGAQYHVMTSLGKPV